MSPETSGLRLTPAAQRILDVASELFYRRGIHAVGVDTIAAESGVTKRTLYDRFGSKDGLLLAYLHARDRRWRDLVTAHIEAAGGDDRVLAPFDALAEWMLDGSRWCCFVNAAAELPDPAHPARQAIGESKRWLRDLFRDLLDDAQVPDADQLARQLLTLHEGALVVFSLTGEPTAARDARTAGATLVALLRPPGGR